MLIRYKQNSFLFKICDTFDIKYISLCLLSQFFLKGKKILQPKSILIIATTGEPIYKIHQIHKSSNSISIVIQVAQNHGTLERNNFLCI